VLLEAGANPNDGVTLPIAASAGADGIDALELLHAHGADANQPWATDGRSALHAVLGWTSGIAGVRWLLEHGARVNDVFGPLAETALHVSARRCGADMIDLLVRHGAVIDARRADGRTAYALAAKSGNRDAAEALLRHRADATLAEADRFVAACATGDRATADALVARRPELRAQGAEALQEVLRAAAERGDLPTLALALDHGAGPDATDEMGRTALHCAAMAGWPDVARALLERGASVTARDAEFHAQPLIWAAEGSRSVGSDGGKRDHAAVGRLLLAAGSPVDWSPGDEPSAAIVEIVESWSQGG
jgi:ankyrin repeat protein